MLTALNLKRIFDCPLISRVSCLHCFLTKPPDIDTGSDTEFPDSTTSPPSPSSSLGDETPDDRKVCAKHVVVVLSFFRVGDGLNNIDQR